MGRSDKGNQEANFAESILSIMRGSSEKYMDLKQLRNLVLLSHQIDKDDKDSKKKFKKTMLALETDNLLALGEDGLVKLKKSGLQEKSKKKRSSDKDGGDDNKQQDSVKKQRLSKDSDAANNSNNEEEEGANDEQVFKKTPCKGNPLGITRLFLGNLPFAVDESYLKEFLAPAQLTHIKWITDKETGKFYGSAFIEMRNTQDAAIAVTEKNGLELIGRPIRINYAPAREGDLWPPKNSIETGGDSTSGAARSSSSQAGGVGLKSMSAKPEHCFKLFIGNLSYSVDDDAITKFFANVDAEVKTVRWLHHKDSGDFKGCGYVEFWNTEACEKAASLRGKNLLGRPIRIDWAE